MYDGHSEMKTETDPKRAKESASANHASAITVFKWTKYHPPVWLLLSRCLRWTKVIRAAVVQTHLSLSDEASLSQQLCALCVLRVWPRGEVWGGTAALKDRGSREGGGLCGTRAKPLYAHINNDLNQEFTRSRSKSSHWPWSYTGSARKWKLIFSFFFSTRNGKLPDLQRVPLFSYYFTFWL